MSGVTGLFTVSRTGDTTRALTVNYFVAGTAKSGTDYTALPGSVTIPIGASSANIVVTPINDLNPLVANPLTVVVTLSPSSQLYRQLRSRSPRPTRSPRSPAARRASSSARRPGSLPLPAVSLVVSGFPTAPDGGYALQDHGLGR